MAQASIRPYMKPRAAPGPDAQARLREEPRRFAGELVRARPCGRARRPEARDGRPVDLLDRLEAGEELAPDRPRALPQMLERMVRLEEVAILQRLDPTVPGGEQSGDERRREQDVEEGDEIGVLRVRRDRLDRDAVLVPDPAAPRRRDGPDDRSAVEEADREQIGRIEQEAEVGELCQP